MTFHHSGCTIQDPDFWRSWRWASEFLGIEKLISFSLIRGKQKVTMQNCYINLLKTSLLRECRRHYPGNDWILQDSAPSHRVKVTQQLLRQNTPDFIAAGEWASYSPDLILCIAASRVACRIWCTKADDFRLQVYRSNQKQVEGGHHWDSSIIHCTVE